MSNHASGLSRRTGVVYFMHRAVMAGMIALMAMGWASHSWAATPLVTPQWVLEHLQDDTIRFVDLQPPAGYERVHLPGACKQPI